MPATNSIKSYIANSYYHIYNRGVEKRDIFLDEQDFAVFLSYLKSYLLPKDENSLRSVLASSSASSRDKDQAAHLLRLNNFSNEIELLCYSLLPNHFHLLVYQHSRDAIDRFINSLGTRYTKYFNRRYSRVGGLYQGVYKAVLVETENQLLHLSRYIHLNPFNWLGIPVSRLIQNSLPSSLMEYLGQRQTDWVKTDRILGYFRKSDPRGDYLKFIDEHADMAFISPLVLDYQDVPTIIRPF